jgi:prenyltransferase beta subunit
MGFDGMQTLADSLIRTAAASRYFLEKDARMEVVRFIRAKQHPDGGFCGRDNQRDLYYTLFAVASLRILRQRIPALRLWKYLRSYGMGETLDLVHLASLVSLRSFLPMRQRTRRALYSVLESRAAETPYDAFLKRFALPRKTEAASVKYDACGPTPTVAAALILNGSPDKEGEALLRSRHGERGGFCATPEMTVPDLLSTAVALVALQTVGANIDDFRKPCLEYVSSLWRESGGFAGHVADEFEDVEYTFYALLSIGCLVTGRNGLMTAETQRSEGKMPYS